MVTPTIHRNGTSAKDLVAVNMKALEAVQAALSALGAASPNGRDYYPQGMSAVDAATEEHFTRMASLTAIISDLENIVMSIQAQNG